MSSSGLPLREDGPVFRLSREPETKDVCPLLLVESGNILLALLHARLGLMTTIVKAIDQTRSDF
jgi:hypothetical protein